MAKLIILLLISFSASAQWKENGQVQIWPATIHLKDSVTGKSKGVIKGYVKAVGQVYWVNGKIDINRGVDWTKITAIMNANKKLISWKEYDYYETAQPNSSKTYMR